MTRLLNATFITFVLCAVCCQASGQTKLKVVTTTLDMADFAEQVGGDRAEVYPIFTGKYDIHFFEPRPSQVIKLREADLLIVAGLDIDIWIRALIDAARNPRVLFGASGYVDPSVGVRPIQVPEGRIDGSMGDVHPYGNPHFWFTQENVRIAVNNICEGLSRVSPENAQVFTERKDLYLKEVERTCGELHAKLAPLKGAKMVEYHQSWDYFADEFGLEIVATLEPKPGIPPSPAHLSEVVATMKSAGARLLLVEPYYPQKPVQFVVKQTGAKVLRLPLYLGGKEGITTYLDNLRYNVNSIVEALSSVTK